MPYQYEYDHSKPPYKNRYPHSAWAYEWYEADEARHWRKYNFEDVSHGRGGPPAHRNPDPADDYPDADVVDMAYRACDCGERFLVVFAVDGEPVESPSACEACREVAA